MLDQVRIRAIFHVVNATLCILLAGGFTALMFPHTTYADWYPYGQRYAIIVMGGHVTGPPHYQWYWNDTSSMFRELISYGFTGDNIYFFSYGDSADAHPDWVDAVSTTENIRAAYQWAQAQCTANDLLYIYWVDHGSQTYFETYNGTMSHAELGTLMDPIVAKQIIGAYNPCYSGAVIDDISRIGVITVTSQDASHPNSWGWAGMWRRALSGAPEDSVDTNCDGHISMTEAYNWIAPQSQAAGEHSMFDDNGDGVGHEWAHPGYDPNDPMQDGYNGRFYSLDGWTDANNICGSLSDTLGPGTYHVVGNIWVESDNSLRLMPGTTFLFDSAFSFTIYGTLLAQGTERDSILFTTDTLCNSTRWRGIRFLNANDASRLEYCRIEYGKAIGGWPGDGGGGGIYCDHSSPAILHCVIRNNSADYMGGGIFCYHSFSYPSDPELEYCTITDNSAAELGGGISCDGSSPTLTNCTISGNSAQLGCGVACVSAQEPPYPPSNVVAKNTIVWGNECFVYPNEPTYVIGNASFTATYCDIEGGWPGVGNIDCNPLFDENYCLTWVNYPADDNTKSCCIDAGDPTSPHDPDGTRADIGACYYFHPSEGPSAWLHNDNGIPSNYTTAMGSEWTWAEKLHPTWTQFRIDSVKFAVYRYSGATQTLTFRIHLYEDDGALDSYNCPSGTIVCDAAGTQKWASANMVTPSMATNQWYWFAFNVPDCTFTGDFVVGIEIAQTGSAPSLLTDSQNGIPCCVNSYYYHYVGQPNGQSRWYEHYDFWDMFGHPSTPPPARGIYFETDRDPNMVGYNMIRVKGTNIGTPLPPTLQLSTHDMRFGHSMMNWEGGPEAISDTLIFTNIGGMTDTITSITCTNPVEFFHWENPPLPWVLGAGQSRNLAIDFQPMDTGWRYADLTVNHTGQNRTVDICHMSGIGFDGHWLENFCQNPDPLCGPWNVVQDSCTDKPWAIRPNFGLANHSAGHLYTDLGCYAVDWYISSPFKNPDASGIIVKWSNYNYFNSDYGFHGLYWTAPDCVSFYYVAEIPPTTEGEWIEEGPRYINSLSDSIQLVFLYKGEQADNWFIDDIQVDTLRPMPPILAHEHHSHDGPATWINPDCVHITVQAMDPNDDLSYVKLWYMDITAGGSWTTVDMSAVSGCEYMHLYEGDICGLTVCHSYAYYFEANDVAATGPTYLPPAAPTDYYRLDIMDNTQPQIAYDDGVPYLRTFLDAWWARYAVRFTPTSYPYYLGGAMVHLANNWPDDLHQDIVVEVYDDNGPDNMPGTFLCNAIMDVGTSWNPPYAGVGACDDTSFGAWVYAKIYPCIEIAEGDFYIAARNLDNAAHPNMESCQWDQTPSGSAYPAYRTYIGYPQEGGTVSWTIDTMVSQYGPHGDLLLRAIQCACVPAPPDDVTILANRDTLCGSIAAGCSCRNAAKIFWMDAAPNLSYKIYRSTTDPFSGFTPLATVAPGVQVYVDSIGANMKAFYRITGSCDPPEAAATVVPPSKRQGLRQ